MARRNKKKAGRNRSWKGGAPPRAPRVHVRVALADNNFRAATALIRPAVLYADHVTVYSPAASLLNAAMSLGTLSDPRQQIDAIVELVSKVPSLASQFDVDPDILRQMQAFMSADRRVVREMARIHDSERQVDEFYEKMDGFHSLWDEQIPRVLDEIRSTFEAGEFFDAMDTGYLRVANLGSTSKADYLAASLRAATGDRDAEGLDQTIADFTARLVEILTERESFPLLDDASAELARALEREGTQFPLRSMRRGAEVSSAVSFMGFLPSFEYLPMDEIIGLRTELARPLARFRGALARLSREFEMRPIDEEFEGELEDAWRGQVEPALAEIRETLAEHGLLKEVASVALGDPRRLIAEAGGVVAAANGAVASFPGLMTAGLAVGVPLADSVGRALSNRIQARREVRKNAFFFLHRLEMQSARH